MACVGPVLWKLVCLSAQMLLLSMALCRQLLLSTPCLTPPSSEERVAALKKSADPEMIDEVPTQVPVALKLAKVAKPASPFDIDVVETRPEVPKRVVVWGEQVLTFFAFIFVLTITLLILLAVLSDRANAMIAGILHVDIRAEIEYLWRLIGHH